LPENAEWTPVIRQTPRGGRTAAILASLTSTRRRHEIDPQLYLTQLLENLLCLPKIPSGANAFGIRDIQED